MLWVKHMVNQECQTIILAITYMKKVGLFKKKNKNSYTFMIILGFHI